MKLTRTEFLAGIVGIGLASAAAPACGPGDPDRSDGGAGDGGTGDGGTGDGGAGDGGTGDGGTGDGGTGDGGTSDGGIRSCSPTIGGNHGHVLVVPPEDVQAGQERTYDIQGGSAHNHRVTLTSANFATLAGGGTITVSSSNDAFHQHSVTVRCA